MAGRPRLYTNAAEKTRAYRERQEKRTIIADRQSFECTVKDMKRLTCAVMDAQKRGDELALSLKVVTTTDMLADLALYFETGTITPRAIRTQKQPGRKRPKLEPGGSFDPCQ